MNFDEIGLKDEIELMNIQKRLMQDQQQGEQTIGFNLDTIYDQIENNQNNL